MHVVQDRMQLDLERVRLPCVPVFNLCVSHMGIEKNMRWVSEHRPDRVSKKASGSPVR